jgi:hypothetical protein
MLLRRLRLSEGRAERIWTGKAQQLWMDRDVPLPTKQTERVISIFVVGFVRFVLPQIKLSAHGENSSLFASYTQCQATSIGAVSNGTLPVLQ